MPNTAISPSIMIWQVSAKDKSEYPKDYIERYLKDDFNNWTDLNFDHANDGMCLKLEEEILSADTIPLKEEKSFNQLILKKIRQHILWKAGKRKKNPKIS